MKKFAWAILAIVMIILSSCQKQEYVEFDDLNPQDDGVLKISVSDGPLGGGLKSSSAINGDTVSIEGGNVYSFTYSSTITMNSVQWTFSNNGNTSSDPLASNYYGRQFIVSNVTLVGVDNQGVAHQAQLHLNCLPRVDGDPVLYKGKTYLAPGFYRSEFWIYKNGAWMENNIPYKIKGNFTSPAWTVFLDIPIADTNYRMENNQLYPMPSNQTGHWVKVFIDNAVNSDIEAAPLVRLSALHGEQWANFKGSIWANPANLGMLKYHVDANGDPTPNGSSGLNLPGIGGDNYIRYGLPGNGNIIIYQNNETPFSVCLPWIQFNVNDSWATPMLSSYQTTGFPNWSQYEIPISEMPKKARFGSNIQNGTPNPNNSSCLYWDNVYKYLFLSVEVVETSGHNGTTFQTISIRHSAKE